MPSKNPLHAFLIAALLVMLPLYAHAQQDESQQQISEQKIKAGLMYNFLKYTEWPAEKKTDTPLPLKICVFDADDPFDGYLQPIEERTVNQRAIKIHHISAKSQLAGCHMLFLSSDEQARWPTLQSYLTNKSILTVGDFSGFSTTGGMIEFSTEDSRVQIRLNMEAVSAAHLMVQDSLRRLAKTTHPSPAGSLE